LESRQVRHDRRRLRLGAPGARRGRAARFSLGVIGPERREGPSFDTLLTVTLRPDPNGTVLNLVHEQLDELAAAMPHIANAVESGWEAFLDNLARVLASTNGRGSPADEV